MADIDPSVQRLLEALDSVSDSIRTGQDAFEDSKDKSKEVTRKLDSELRKLGLTLKTVTDQEDDLVKKRQDRAKLEEEVNEKLRKSGKVREDATQAELEHYKNTQKQNVLFESTLASMGRYIDANNKIVKSSVDLTSAQQKTIDKFKSHDQAQDKFNEMMGGMGKTLGMFAAKAAFEVLTAAVIGTYRGMIVYQDMLLGGAEGETVIAAQRATEMRAMAQATENIGRAMQDTATNTFAVGAAMLALNPIAGLVTIGLSGLAWILGKGAEAAAEIQKREADLEEKRGKIVSQLFQDFQKLSSASLTGAEGMTGVRENLEKFGLSLAHFDKFGKALQENTRNLALFGAGTVDGVKKFTETASKLVTSELGKTLETMGVTVEEQMSHTAAYMTQQAKFGLKINQDQAAAAGKYIQELDKLAVLTGATRKEQEDARKAVLNINQLRSAMIEAAESGQTAKAQELQRAFETASSMMAAGMKDEAGAFARLISAGGVVDADTARAQQMYGGKGGLVESTRTGQGSEFERLEMAARGAYQQEARFAGTTKLTGTISGMTSGNVGAIADLMTTLKKYGESEEAKKGMKFEEYVEKTRTVTDKATIDQLKKMREDREEALKLQTSLLTGQDIAAKTMLAAGNKMLDAANKMLNLKGMPDQPISTPGGVGSKESQVSQQFKTERQKKEALEIETRLEREKLEIEKGRAAEEVKVARLKEFEARQNAEKARAFEQHALRKQSMASTWGGPARLPTPTPSLPSSTGGGSSSDSSRTEGTVGTYSRSAQSRSSGTGGSETTIEKLKRAGLILRPYGDVHREGAEVDDRLINKSLELQAMFGDNFGMFTSFNDNYHKETGSDHAKGLAVDFTLKRKPTVEEGKKLVAQLKSMGFIHAQDEYNFPSPNATGDHIHAALGPKAFHGGIFDGPMSGYQVEMHGKEAIVPLNDPASRLKATENVSSEPLSSMGTNNSTTDNRILTDLFGMMENKFDDMIRKLDTGNGYADKLVKAMA